MKKIIIAILLVYATPMRAGEVVFEGYPVKKIETNENSSNVSVLSKDKSAEFKVVITQDGGNYFWDSRGNTQVVPVQSGFYITFLAVNGVGYVRTLTPEARNIFKQLPIEEQQKQYIYFEHLIHQMGSITYYGR